jgi:A/G-specific adenine glycosylase
MRSNFAERVLAWYDEHGRKDLPWQHDRSGYRVWISEVMLQQTQVQTVIPYFERFVQSFPDATSLANAATDDVLQHWSGLGYYARARNLHRAATIIRDDHGGEFPQAFEDVLALPGIGRSTAGAILALAFGQRHPILDGNVKRVLARHAAIDGWPGVASVGKQLWELADELTPQARVDAYTQAMMDIGATVCTRSRPACTECPVSEDCHGLATGEPERFPGRKPRRERPLRTTTMVLAVADGAVYLERRPASGIWGGLWSLPEVGDVDAWCSERLNMASVDAEAWDSLRHSFSHYDLDITPIVVRVDAVSSRVADDADSTWHRLGAAPPGGIAAPVSKLINTLRNTPGISNDG